MRKSDKKIENQLRVVLTEVCDIALKDFDSFEWLTHLVNYNDFPRSLQVVCIFDNNDNLASFIKSSHSLKLNTLIKKKLLSVGINLKNTSNHIIYDSEESCRVYNNGNWAERLKSGAFTKH